MTTPLWVSPVDTDVNDPAGIVQFMGAHAWTSVYDGVSAFQVITGFPGTPQSLLGFVLDQPFTQAGANIARITFSPSGRTGIGADIIVDLFADSGGLPSGGSLARVILPAEFLPAAGPFSVPLTASGLSNGAQYHIVLSSPNSTGINSSEILSLDVGSLSPTANYNTGSGWVAFPAGTVIPMSIFSQGIPHGYLIHTYEDSGARWTWIPRDAVGNPMAIGESTGTSKSYRTISYDPTTGLVVSAL